MCVDRERERKTAAHITARTVPGESPSANYGRKTGHNNDNEDDDNNNNNCGSSSSSKSLNSVFR